jgi:hypothetical protein
MKMTASLAVLFVLLCIFTTQELSSEQEKATNRNPGLLIIKCVNDGFDVEIPDHPEREKIARVADVNLEAGFRTEDEGAIFWFMRGGKEIFKFSAKDLYSSSVWIAVDHDRRLDGPHDQAHIALTYSDGGAIGGFHVRVFFIDGNGVKDVSKSVDGAVADFKSRNYCKVRGNNVTALKWMGGSLLLLTEVYPTGECGPDTGHLEGYLVSVPAGKILAHLTLNQLTHYPGICLENEDDN